MEFYLIGLCKNHCLSGISSVETPNEFIYVSTISHRNIFMYDAANFLALGNATKIVVQP